MNAIVVEKLQDFFEQGIPPVFGRDLSLGDILEPARGNLATVVTGVRRCGKTYRLYQEMHRIVKAGYPQESILYFNFEDERLKPYTPQLLSDVVEAFFSLRPRAQRDGAFFFFDEIQEVSEWGTFLRRMVDTRKATIYVTGSSSKMLSANLASEFRGRALSRELFPLSFSEFARFHGVETGSRLDDGSRAIGSMARASLRRALSAYLERGGFVPVQRLSSSDSVQLLQEYAYRTVNLDVIERYNVRNPVLTSQFLSRCLASSARELSLNKTVSAFKSAGVSASRETLSNLLGFYEEAYLLFKVDEFTRALADNPRSVSKVYAVDPGMLMAFSPSAARDEAQRLETAVFMKLRRDAGSLRKGAVSRLLLRDGARHEVDFVVGDALVREAYELVQVTCSMREEKTRRREVSALRAGMAALGVREGWVVTLDEEEEITVDEGVVHVVPAWRWLLD